jgi:hypothetical protein
LPTPATVESHSDTTIEILGNGVTRTSLPVSVVIPAAIHGTATTPLPQPNVVVTGKALALTTHTSPANPLMTGTKALLVTGYFVPLQVPVVDQFGDDLSDIYVGTPVSEGAHAYPINQTIQEGGTYTDPVGAFPVRYKVVTVAGQQAAQPDNPIIANRTINPGKAAVTNWEATGAQALFASTQGTEEIVVKVGGFRLNPGVHNRTVTVTKGDGLTARVKIVWLE